jgi:hypothetical protein
MNSNDFFGMRSQLEKIEKTSFHNKLLENMFLCPADGFVDRRINPLNCNGHYMSLARVYVSYLVQRAFSIYRLPSCQEKINQCDYKLLTAFLNDLPDQEIENHLE